VGARVRLQVLGANTLLDLTSPATPAPLGCGSVQASGGGTADLVFRHVAAWQFKQMDISTIAVMRTREADGTLLESATPRLCARLPPPVNESLCVAR